MGQRVVILEVQSFTFARGFTVECQWNGGSGGPGEGLGLPPSLDFPALDRSGVPLEKTVCWSLGRPYNLGLGSGGPVVSGCQCKQLHW